MPVSERKSLKLVTCSVKQSITELSGLLLTVSIKGGQKGKILKAREDRKTLFRKWDCNCH